MPRAAAPTAGLRTPARDHFPAGVLTQGSDLALTSTADILRYEAVRDPAGGTKMVWNLAETDVPARIDALGGDGATTMPAGQLQEGPTHAVRLANGSQATEGDRVAIEGATWAVIGRTRRTADITEALLVREVG